jgi:hypothetical protein
MAELYPKFSYTVTNPTEAQKQINAQMIAESHDWWEKHKNEPSIEKRISLINARFGFTDNK